MGGEVAAGAVLHHDVDRVPAERVVLEEDGVHLDELRILQPRQLHRLLSGLARGGEARHDHLLDRNLLSGAEVLGQQRRAEAAPAEHPQQLVLTDGVVAAACGHGLREHRAVRARGLGGGLDTGQDFAGLGATEPHADQVILAVLEEHWPIHALVTKSLNMRVDPQLVQKAGHVVHAPRFRVGGERHRRSKVIPAHKERKW